MSLFFDVWTSGGFVLASDVRIIENGEEKLDHKLAVPPLGSKVSCALAVCGEYPEVSKNFFHEVISTSDTLRTVAHKFASRWTDRFGGTEEYSAVHLVGFNEVSDLGLKIPQMWFWANWSGTRFGDKSHFEDELASFDEPMPNNNHIPHVIRQLTGKFPEPTPESEAELVQSFLKIHEPYFTWNGDTNFWRSAAEAVGSAMNLIGRQKASWSVQDAAKIAEECLRFLASISTLLESSTVGLSPGMECDVLAVRPAGVEKLSWADINKEL